MELRNELQASDVMVMAGPWLSLESRIAITVDAEATSTHSLPFGRLRDDLRQSPKDADWPCAAAWMATVVEAEATSMHWLPFGVLRDDLRQLEKLLPGTSLSYS